MVGEAGHSFPGVDLFRRVRLTVHDRVFRVNRCAVEFGELGLPDIERFHGIAPMRVAIGIDKMLRHCLRCRATATWGGLNMKKLGHLVSP
jgi:hypothetical protein